MLLRKVNLCWIYLRDFFFLSIIISLFSWFITWLNGAGAFGVLIMVKLVITVSSMFYHQQRKHKEIYFYLNNGIGEWQLFSAGVIVDLSLWAFISLILL